jgi:hypothetical protein
VHTAAGVPSERATVYQVVANSSVGDQGAPISERGLGLEKEIAITLCPHLHHGRNEYQPRVRYSLRARVLKRQTWIRRKLETDGILRTLRLVPPQAVHAVTCSSEQHVISCRVADPALAPVLLWSPSAPLITLYESHAVAAVGGNAATGGNVGDSVGVCVGASVIGAAVGLEAIGRPLVAKGGVVHPDVLLVAGVLDQT